MGESKLGEDGCVCVCVHTCVHAEEAGRKNKGKEELRCESKAQKWTKGEENVRQANKS